MKELKRFIKEYHLDIYDINIYYNNYIELDIEEKKKYITHCENELKKNFSLIHNDIMKQQMKRDKSSIKNLEKKIVEIDDCEKFGGYYSTDGEYYSTDEDERYYSSEEEL